MVEVNGACRHARYEQSWLLCVISVNIFCNARRPAGCPAKQDSLQRFIRVNTNKCDLFVGCLMSQQHASISQGRICSDNFTCCHTETEVADQTFHLTQSQYTHTGPTSPSTDPITPNAWRGSHWSANFKVTGMTRPRKNLGASRIWTWDLSLSRRTP